MTHKNGPLLNTALFFLLFRNPFSFWSLINPEYMSSRHLVLEMKCVWEFLMCAHSTGRWLTPPGWWINSWSVVSLLCCHITDSWPAGHVQKLNLNHGRGKKKKKQNTQSGQLSKKQISAPHTLPAHLGFTFLQSFFHAAAVGTLLGLVSVCSLHRGWWSV